MRRDGSAEHTATVTIRTKECTMSVQDASPITDNAEVVRRGYEAFNAADIETLLDIMDETVSWHTPGRGPLAGDYEGRDAAFGQFGQYGGQTNGTFRAELQSVVATGDGRVVGVHRNTAERNGKKLDVDCCIVFEVKDGRVMSGREHFYDLHAWDEFWS